MSTVQGLALYASGPNDYSASSNPPRCNGTFANSPISYNYPNRRGVPFGAGTTLGYMKSKYHYYSMSDAASSALKELADGRDYDVLSIGSASTTQLDGPGPCRVNAHRFGQADGCGNSQLGNPVFSLQNCVLADSPGLAPTNYTPPPNTVPVLDPKMGLALASKISRKTLLRAVPIVGLALNLGDTARALSDFFNDQQAPLAEPPSTPTGSFRIYLSSEVRKQLPGPPPQIPLKPRAPIFYLDNSQVTNNFIEIFNRLDPEKPEDVQDKDKDWLSKLAAAFLKAAELLSRAFDFADSLAGVAAGAFGEGAKAALSLIKDLLRDFFAELFDPGSENPELELDPRICCENDYTGIIDAINNSRRSGSIDQEFLKRLFVETFHVQGSQYTPDGANLGTACSFGIAGWYPPDTTRDI